MYSSASPHGYNFPARLSTDDVPQWTPTSRQTQTRAGHHLVLVLVLVLHFFSSFLVTWVQISNLETEMRFHIQGVQHSYNSHVRTLGSQLMWVFSSEFDARIFKQKNQWQNLSTRCYFVAGHGGWLYPLLLTFFSQPQILQGLLPSNCFVFRNCFFYELSNASLIVEWGGSHFPVSIIIRLPSICTYNHWKSISCRVRKINVTKPLARTSIRIIKKNKVKSQRPDIVISGWNAFALSCLEPPQKFLFDYYIAWAL